MTIHTGELPVLKTPKIGTKKTLAELERDRILESTRVEHDWWHSRYMSTTEEGLAAKERGELVEVPYGVPGRNYDLIRMPEMTRGENGQLNLLRPKALRLLEQISERFGGEKHGDEKIVLAVTSLWRDNLAQQDLTRNYAGTAAGVGESSHHSGSAFDISLGSYWTVNSVGQRTRIQKWGLNRESFLQDIEPSLVSIVGNLQAEGCKLNYVVESILKDNVTELDQLPKVLHVCIAPDND